MNDLKIARALGWASLAIGVTEFAAPGFLERQLGVKAHRGLLKALGVREALSGLAILTEKRPTKQLSAGMWSRVAGDAMDLALLAAAARKSRRPAGLLTAIGMVVGIAFLDCVFAERVQRAQSNGRHMVSN